MKKLHILLIFALIYNLGYAIYHENLHDVLGWIAALIFALIILISENYEQLPLKPKKKWTNYNQ